jgi:2-hydroxychromene-2-carboxylate isomerase
MPDPFPANTLKAARLAIVGIDAGWVAPFSRAVFEAEFGHGRDIASEVVLEEVLAGLGLDAPALLACSGAPEIKERLRAATAEAETAGIFGAPSFVAPPNELFWGDDRLEAALAVAANSAA